MLLERSPSTSEDIAITFVLLVIWWGPYLLGGVFAKWLIVRPARRKAVAAVLTWGIAVEIALGFLFTFSPLEDIVPHKYFGIDFPVEYLYGKGPSSAIFLAVLIVTVALLVCRSPIRRKISI